MEMTSLFELLKQANQSGVYCLKNKADNSVYINWSSNIPKTLVRLLSSNLFFPEFDFELLEIVTESKLLRIRCQYFKDLYSSNKYTIINPGRVSNCKLVIGTMPDFRVKDNNRYLFQVKIVQRSYWEATVGVFEEYVEVEDFCALHYSSNKVYNIIYSSNKLTKGFLNVSGK